VPSVVDLPGTGARWTTANVDEGLPGTLTPLTWSFYARPVEQATRTAWIRLGAMAASEAPIPADIDQRFYTPVLGHAAANVDLFGEMAGRMPGGSAAALEEQLFGSRSPEAAGRARLGRRRYPFVAVKAPGTILGAIRALEPLARETEVWWRRSVAAPDARTTLRDAYGRFARILNVHLVLTMACQGVLERVAALAAAAGLPGLEHELIRSDTGTAEFELVADLRALSARSLGLDAFLSRHGYHGPREGLLDAVVWREDPAPVETLAESYRRRGLTETTAELVARRRADHAAACARLTSALGPLRAGPARALIGFAARAPVWRETGRANILRAVDVARAAARAIGAREFDDPEDVFFLTVDELLAGGDHALVVARRADHERFERVALPQQWRGAPPAVAPDVVAATNGARSNRLVGLGVSAGVAEGIVRVVHDQREADLSAGEVLVCRATDPSWASLFPLAEAVVTDVGSSLSHAAIVCRELGIPCVANTRIATDQLRDGDRIRVDGTTGQVEVLT
jgi:phosphohistidine swiveling domain-containing protein